MNLWVVDDENWRLEEGVLIPPPASGYFPRPSRNIDLLTRTHNLGKSTTTEESQRIRSRSRSANPAVPPHPKYPHPSKSILVPWGYFTTLPRSPSPDRQVYFQLEMELSKRPSSRSCHPFRDYDFDVDGVPEPEPEDGCDADDLIQPMMVWHLYLALGVWCL